MSDSIQPLPRQSNASQRLGELIDNPFRALTSAERQLLVCALAGNHPPRLAHLRMGVLRKLARADREGSANRAGSDEVRPDA